MASNGEAPHTAQALGARERLRGDTFTQGASSGDSFYLLILGIWLLMGPHREGLSVLIFRKRLSACYCPAGRCWFWPLDDAVYVVPLQGSECLGTAPSWANSEGATSYRPRARGSPTPLQALASFRRF